MLWIRKIHKWASVIVGIQFLLWLSSGLYFNLMDHDKAGGHAYRSHHKTEVEIDNQQLVDIKQVLNNFKPSVAVNQLTLLAKPYYLLSHEKGLYANFVNRYTLVDAYTGQQRIIDDAMANALAEQSYSGPGNIISTRLIEGVIDDFPKQYNPTWQVNFADEVETSVYVEADSGRIVGHSDNDKRLADIFFMLHFMDYANLGGFNSIQMILFAFVSLWLSLSGMIWTIDLGLRGQYQLKWLAKKRQVKLFDKDRKSMGTVIFSTHTNLLDGLVEHDIVLPSTCGGGGTCGRCKVMINPAVKSTSADQVHFSEQELAQGYRLACQHFSDDIDHMTLMDVTNAQKHRLELVQSRFISPFIKELRFKVKGGYQLSFQAGAFMRFFIPAAKTSSTPRALVAEFEPHWQHIHRAEFEHQACTRSYSCAESSSTTDELVFTIKMQSAPNKTLSPGVASHYLCNLVVGSTVEALGPFEEFGVKPNSQKTMVLIGAGSGMAPLKAIIDEQLALHRSAPAEVRPIYFFYGARTEVDLLYADDFYQLADQHGHFHYYPVLSKPDEQWLGAAGYAQQILALNLDSLGDISQLEFYLCGPQGMMDEVITLLKTKGVNEQDIRFDLFK
jgi:Na(+)-translocating NADH:ubiquinone oxidoreductase F subunit